MFTSFTKKLEIHSERILEVTGHLFFIGFTLWAALYFRERLLNNDAGYYTWHLVNNLEPFIKHERYINYLTMLPPALAAKMGASLKTTLIIYSSIFGLIYYTYFLIATYRWKNLKAGILLVLALILTMRTKHYAGHTEVTMAIGQLALLWAWITADKNQGEEKSKYYWPVIAVILAMMLLTHPVIVVPLLMLLGYKMIDRSEWKSKHSWSLMVLSAVLFAIKIFSATSYETDKASSLGSAVEVFTNPEKYYVFHIVKRFFEKELHLPTLIFLLSVGFLIRMKKYLSGIYILCCAIVLLAMVIVSHSYLQSDVYIMVDGYMGMLGIVFAVVITQVFLKNNHRLFGVPLVLLLVVYSSDRIISRGDFFTKRLAYYQKTFDMYPEHSKLFVPMSLHDWEQLYYPYEIPAESLILTCMEGKEHCKTLYMDYGRKGPDLYTGSDQRFLFFNKQVRYENLNANFFTLPDEAYLPIEKVAWR